MIGVGAMIGAGIFVLTGIAAGIAGPGLILVFLLNGVVTLFTAMSYAELGSCFHDAGGGYLWIKEGLPQPNGFLSARYTVAEGVATLVYWLVLVLAFQMLGWVLGLVAVTNFFGQVLDYLPRVLVAVVIALVGLAIGTLFGGAVQVAAANADLPVARPLGRVVKYVIAFFALALAFEQLNIASRLLTTTFLIVVAAGCFGVALAFGLGCKDLAREMFARWLSQRREASESQPRSAATPPRS